MSSPDQDRMDALSEAMVRLIRRMDDVEGRIARLEGAKGAPTSAIPASQPLPVPQSRPAVPPPLPVSRAQQLPPPLPAPAPQLPGEMTGQTQLETRIGLTWVNRIGVVTLIIGVAFFFKYAIDNQWIGETGRVVLGILAGLAALGVGDVLWRRDQKIYAQGLSGLGISILYLSFYATFGYYHLLPQAAAFGLMTMVTAVTGALALRYAASAIAVLGMLGGYLTPLLLSTGHDAPWFFFGYLLLIDIGGVALARVRRWLGLDAMAFVATALLYLSWYGAWFNPQKAVVATVATLAFYALFATVEWEWIFYATQALAALALTAIWPEAVPYLALSLAFAAAGLSISSATRKTGAAIVSLAAFWCGYAIWMSHNHAGVRAEVVFVFLSAQFLINLLWLAFEGLVRRTDLEAAHLAILAANGPAYFGFSYFLLKPHYGPWLGLFAVAVGVLHSALGFNLWRARRESNGDMRAVELAGGLALAFLTLAVPIQFTGFSITLAWAIEAAALVWIGCRLDHDLVLAGAVAIYLLVLLRLCAFDAWIEQPHPVIWNTRFITFAFSAASLWLSAWWAKRFQAPAAAAYITGHLILLIAALAELNDWAAVWVLPARQASVTAMGISILMALYAVMLVGIGVARASVLNRILGLGLMGMVIAKVYLFDVWEASHLFRTAAFVSLGVLLLLTSYLYSRFRDAIEGWWRNEEARK